MPEYKFVPPVEKSTIRMGFENAAVAFYETIHKEGKFDIIRFEVVVSICFSLYQDFINDGLQPIETLPVEEKRLYFDVIKQHWFEPEKQVKACKALYAMCVLTSMKPGEIVKTTN